MSTKFQVKALPSSVVRRYLDQEVAQVDPHVRLSPSREELHPVRLAPRTHHVMSRIVDGVISSQLDYCSLFYNYDSTSS